MTEYKNPTPTVDMIIPMGDPAHIVVVRRSKDPIGWALPGGFVNEGETTEDAAIREVFEETGLRTSLRHLLGVYSDPKRDPRQHNMSVVYVGHPIGGKLLAGDDAAEVAVIDLLDPKREKLVFDHEKIVADYLRWDNTEGASFARIECNKQIQAGKLALSQYKDVEPSDEEVRQCISRIFVLLRAQEFKKESARTDNPSLTLNFPQNVALRAVETLNLDLDVRFLTATTSELCW